MTQIAHLPARVVLAVEGADRVAFLNGLVSNDVAEAAPGRAIWAALLTAQGKWLADFFIFSDDARLLLDCEAAQAPMLAARLARYRLRADAAIVPTTLRVFAGWDAPAPGGALHAPAPNDALAAPAPDGALAAPVPDGALAAPVPDGALAAPVPDGALTAPDPRLPEAGWRALAETLPTNAEAAAWDLHRLSLGLPDGSRDMQPEKTVLLEAGFDELHGVSWSKGCYMGQELTARTRYRGLVKRRLLPVHAPARLPPPGTPILSGDREVGLMRSSSGSIGLALLRLDALGGELRAGEDAVLQPCVPGWAVLPGAG